MKGCKDLSWELQERIAVVVSNSNQYHYWIVHDGAVLPKITRNTEFVVKFIEDYKNADISEQDNTIFDYVVKLSKEPCNMVKAVTRSLRNAGFSDEGILDVVNVSGYYAYVKRLIDGLGVELESNSDEN